MISTEFVILAFVILIASVIGGVVSMSLYALGQEGAEAIFSKYPTLNPDRWQKVQAAYEVYGAWVLLLAAVPGISPIIVVGAGFVGLKKWTVFIWIVIGRILRYSILAVFLWLLYRLLLVYT